MRATEPSVPWEVREMSVASGYDGLHIRGLNHYTGETFSWCISHHGLAWSYRQRYGKFRSAPKSPEVRSRLAWMLRRARKEARR